MQIKDLVPIMGYPSNHYVTTINLIFKDLNDILATLERRYGSDKLSSNSACSHQLAKAKEIFRFVTTLKERLANATLTENPKYTNIMKSELQCIYGLTCSIVIQLQMARNHKDISSILIGWRTGNDGYQNIIAAKPFWYNSESLLTLIDKIKAEKIVVKNLEIKKPSPSKFSLFAISSFKDEAYSALRGDISTEHSLNTPTAGN